MEDASGERESDVETGPEASAMGNGEENASKGQGQLVSAARVLTDFTSIAQVYDLITLADRGNSGVG
ncbi:MAG: hypothetical protein V5A24_01845 [Haloarculaceae archaeon]